MAIENTSKTRSRNKTKRQGKKGLGLNVGTKSVAALLIFVVIFLAILLAVELAPAFLQLKDLTKASVVRPVYVVDSQPIDLDAYLREHFANKVPKKVLYVTVTAYSSTNGQTDHTPYHTAVGTLVRDGIVAANFLPIGTVVRFPDKFGDRLFIVEDRMDERFGLQVDIWMSQQEEAKKFGIQYLKMETF